MKKYLALDVGGTKTHIALFSTNDAEQINFIQENKYKTQAAKSLEEIVLDFSPDMKNVEGISIAVAGPVINGQAQLTNVSWNVSKDRIVDVTGVSNVELLNDLEASGFGIPFMTDSDILQIFRAEERMAGNIAIIAPGTGLGEAAMYWDGKEYHPFASEGGHCDFSPRDKTDINLLMFLQHKFGHVSWERVTSGQGIVNIFDFLRTSFDYNLDPELETKMLQGDVAANISKAAIEGELVAAETMKLFVRYLAIESANMALKFKSTGGLFIGGGIIPKIWNEGYKDLFLKYFFDVGRLEPLLRCVDVSIILNPASVLFGAAHYIVSKES